MVAAPAIPHVDLHRADDRTRTRVSWLHSRHSFSFGHHYDPDNTHHGLLLVNNEDTLAPGAGFDSHSHKNVEILTWVLEGELTHQDSMGNTLRITPGTLARLSAGSGVLHAERNNGDGPVRLIQMWIAPDAERAPVFQYSDISAELSDGDLIPIASGTHGYQGLVPINLVQRRATLHVGRLQPGRSTVLPDAAYLHVFLARGSAFMPGIGQLDEGDAVRASASHGLSVATDSGAEILVWEMHTRVSRIS